MGKWKTCVKKIEGDNDKYAFADHPQHMRDYTCLGTLDSRFIEEGGWGTPTIYSNVEERYFDSSLADAEYYGMHAMQQDHVFVPPNSLFSREACNNQGKQIDEKERTVCRRRLGIQENGDWEEGNGKGEADSDRKVKQIDENIAAFRKEGKVRAGERRRQLQLGAGADVVRQSARDTAQAKDIEGDQGKAKETEGNNKMTMSGTETTSAREYWQRLIDASPEVHRALVRKLRDLLRSE